jgi:hypothetical protein
VAVGIGDAGRPLASVGIGDTGRPAAAFGDGEVGRPTAAFGEGETGRPVIFGEGETGRPTVFFLFRIGLLDGKTGIAIWGIMPTHAAGGKELVFTGAVEVGGRTISSGS